MGLIDSLRSTARLIFRLLPYVDVARFNYTIVVSTGRTGTKALSTIIRNCKSTLSVHEPFKTHTFSNLSGISFRQVYLEDRNLFLKKALASRNSNILESDGFLRYCLHSLVESFPSVKVLHVVRNPIDFVMSYASRATSEMDPTPRYLNDNHFDKEMKLPKEVLGRKWESMDIIMRGAWVWYNENCRIERAIENGENYMLIRFEDIFETWNQTAFLQLKEFLEIQDLSSELFLNANRINRTQSFLVPPYNDWTEEQRTFFHSLTDSLATKYGYQ